MIEFHNVFKSYFTNSGEKVVLSGANLTLPTDRNIGILGKNGAGKSTLMRMIGGVEAPDHGEIVSHAFVSPPIGFNGILHNQLSGEENARYAARVYNEDIDRTVAFCKMFTLLGDYFYMPVATYSSGMRMKMAFALTIAIDFDVYLIDEVLAVGDADFRKRCKRIFDERAERSSMIIVTHQPNLLKEYCQSAAVLKDGKLMMFDNLKDAQEAHQL